MSEASYKLSDWEIVIRRRFGSFKYALLTSLRSRGLFTADVFHRLDYTDAFRGFEQNGIQKRSNK